jgi:Holliday junction resolvasome RuvABC endonuclease subunit
MPKKKKIDRPKILGLDTSSVRTGYAVVQIDLRKRKKIEFLDHGSFQVGKGGIGERLVRFQKEIRRILERNKPDTAAIERHHLRFVKTAQTLFKFAGVAITEAAAATSREVDEINQETIRSVLGCVPRTRKEAKEEIMRILRDDYGVEVENDDEGDAVAVAIVGAGRLRKAQTERTGP